MFLSFVETLNLGMQFLRDLLAVRENQAVSIVGIHPHTIQPSVLAEAGNFSKINSINNLRRRCPSRKVLEIVQPSAINSLLIGAVERKGSPQARRSGADKYSGIALKFFNLQKMIEEPYSLTTWRGKVFNNKL